MEKTVELYKIFSVGNFRVTKVRILINGNGEAHVEHPKAVVRQKYLDKNGYQEVEAFKITDIEGLWSLVIPSHFGTFHIVEHLLTEQTGDSLEILKTLFVNYFNVTVMPYGSFHVDICKATEKLLKEIEGRKPMEEWGEEDYERAILASQAKEILDNGN